MNKLFVNSIEISQELFNCMEEARESFEFICEERELIEDNIISLFSSQFYYPYRPINKYEMLDLFIYMYGTVNDNKIILTKCNFNICEKLPVKYEPGMLSYFIDEPDNKSYYCMNCVNCTNCSFSINCAGCNKCNRCCNCTNCSSCYDCINCIKCRECTDCEYCLGCLDCKKCDNCIDTENIYNSHHVCS